MHISIAAEKLFDLGPLPITNSLIATWLTIIIFIILIVIIRIKKNIIPIGIQNVIEYILEFFYQTICDAVEDEKRGQRFFPLVMTIFLFVLLINWLGLLPGFGSIGFYHGHGEHKEFVPYLRGASADLNTTLALALISVFLTQVYSIKYLGFKGFIGRFIKLRSPIYFFVGILELISEFAKIISFSFRLFGNIFAGEVLLLVMITLVPLIIPIPFLILEIFVGFIQALVFALLTLFFIKIATIHEEH